LNVPTSVQNKKNKTLYEIYFGKTKASKTKVDITGEIKQKIISYKTKFYSRSIIALHLLHNLDQNYFYTIKITLSYSINKQKMLIIFLLTLVKNNRIV